MKKKYNKIIIAIIAMVLLLMPLQSFAATTVSFFDEQVTIEDSASKGAKNGETGYKTSTAASRTSQTTNTITIYNKGEKDATISFGYTASSYNSFTIAGVTASESGNHSQPVKAGENFQIVLTAKGSLFSAKTATLTLTNITYAQVSSSSEITFDFDSSLGAVTAGGESVDSGSTVTIGETGAEIVASPATGAKFIAWVYEDGKIISKNPTYEQLPTGDTTVRALFSKDTPYFMVDNTYILSDLNEAAAKGTNLVLYCDGVLPAGDYVITQGKTLLIPFDAANTMYTDKPGYNEDVDSTHAAPYITPTAYRTLTMESGANITVNGAISVSAKQSSAQGTTGHPTGTYGLIDMMEGSSITVNGGGNLYAWGYITGQGKVTAESGATVYECFQIADWRGGTAVSGMVDNKQEVFPMSQYYVQNIEVPLTLKSGAVENGYTSAFVSYAYTQGCSIPFIGPNGMFNAESGSITKDYDEENDRLVIDVNNGTLGMSSISLSMKLSVIGTKTITSKDYVLPINGNITLNVNSGSTVNLSQDIALLPGGEINVYKDATCTFASGTKAFIYDVDNWGEYCSHSNVKLAPVKYSHGGLKTRTEADLVDAKVYVEGVVNASNGYVYVTESGANICGGKDGVVKFKQGTDTVTYQATYYKEGTFDDDPTIYHEIPVTTAKLKNADEDYFEHDEKHTEFNYSDGVWNPKHEEVTVAGVAPTCTEDGMTDGIKCSLCDAWIKEQTTVPKSGHTYENYVCGCGKKKIITSTGYSIDGENIIITPTLAENDDLASVIMIAVYDSSHKLLDSKAFLKNQLDKVTFSNKDVNNIKVFSWGGFTTIEPIALPEEISVTQ